MLRLQISGYHLLSVPDHKIFQTYGQDPCDPRKRHHWLLDNKGETTMTLVLQKGRPADTTGRLDKEIRTYDLLDSLGVEYDRVDHAPAMTMEDCKEVDEILESMVCKNLFLCNRQETAFYLLMIPDTKVFHTKDLSAQIGSARLSFAKPEYMEKFLDITPGSVSVLGLMNDTEHQVKLLIDEEVLDSEYFGCHPCINTSSLRMRTADLIEKVLPAMGHDFVKVKL